MKILLIEDEPRLISVLDDTPAPGLQTITVRDTVAMEGVPTPRFMRLRVSVP